MLLELTILRCYSNRGINLEQRIKFTSLTRASDLAKIGVAAALLGAAFFSVGWFSFKKQSCEKAFFTLDDVKCFDCKEIFGDQCLNCVDNKSCLACKPGNFLDNGQCNSCSLTWTGCTYCTKSGCLNCEDGFYLDMGVCKKCSDIEGCVAGQCTISGCQQCTEGNYVSGKICKSCA